MKNKQHKKGFQLALDNYLASDAYSEEVNKTAQAAFNDGYSFFYASDSGKLVVNFIPKGIGGSFEIDIEKDLNETLEKYIGESVHEPRNMTSTDNLEIMLKRLEVMTEKVRNTIKSFNADLSKQTN